ncbi:MAG: PEP-CTERM sorting domain-containing protein [Chthoniobacteraceae bacterium]
MKTTHLASTALAAILAALLNFTTTAPAAITGVAAGDAAPALTLGPYPMTPFLPDVRPEFGFVNTVPSPISGNVGSSINLQHLLVGSGWGTWSNGYAGDAYYTDGALSLTLTLPADTGAFYFYAQPNDFAAFNFTATAQNGTQILQSAAGNAGATYFGFFGTGGDTVQSVTISSTTDFAIGQFGIANVNSAIPEPGTALFGVALLGASLTRRGGRRQS